MLAHLAKTALRTQSLRTPTFKLVTLPRRFYYPNGQLMQREEGDYYADPINVAERIVRLIALHDNVRDPAAVTLNSTWE